MDPLLTQPNPALPRKERERLARRDEILNAARVIFSERGFKNATLDEIAETAELGKGTIYNYFSSKEELFVSVIIRGVHRFQAFVEKNIRDEMSARQKIDAYIDAAVDFFEKHQQLFSILELERNSIARNLKDEMFEKFCQEEAILHRYLAGLFDEGIRRREFKDGDSLKLAQMLFGLLHIAYVQAVREPDKWHMQQDAPFIKQLFFHGILANKEGINSRC